MRLCNKSFNVKIIYMYKINGQHDFDMLNMNILLAENNEFMAIV